MGGGGGGGGELKHTHTPFHLEVVLATLNTLL